MEKVICEVHGGVCMLKTGVKDGPTKGKSFYVCVEKHGCDFNRKASLSPSHCLQHEESMVELQALTSSQQQQCSRLFYRCIVGKKAGQKWCGSVPWTEKKHEKQAQASCLPLVRNPFKLPEKVCEDSEWKKLHCVPRDVEGGGEVTSSVAQRESDQRATVEKKEQIVAHTHRGEELPAGLKLKKRSEQEEEDFKASSEQEEQTPPPSSAKAAEQTSPDVLKDSTRRPAARAAASTSTNSGASDDGDQPGPPSHSGRRQKEEDDVVFVSVTPPAPPIPPASAVQKTLTAYPGFQPASKANGPLRDPQGMHKLLSVQLQQKKATLSAINVEALPDKGQRLRTQVRELEAALESLSLASMSPHESRDVTPPSSSGNINPFSRPGGAILLPASQVPAPAIQSSQGSCQTYGAAAHVPAYYGGRMTDDRLLAVKNATCEAIDHLHKSLESCPSPDTEAPDPKGLKVSLLAHQRSALAWLLWRETHNPCGGILADDMGLGKTLTMIALILANKVKPKGDGEEEEEEEEEEEGAKKKGEKKQGNWLSKTDGHIVPSKSTLIICPASLVHHWKKEIERHVKAAKLTVYLYHGPDRKKCARVLAGHDVVVTTYSLVSKEAPVQKETEKPQKEGGDVPARSGPLLRVAWSRVILDEAHNIKNPKVQTSMAVCQLRAGARWAVTGTPIQNNLLDMYSLLKFLRCSPFDEYKLWKAQVDNGSKRGRERLNILTRTLLLRRTKDQLDSSGKPLVSLPSRTCKVHQLKLSVDEQAVYNVVFDRSRSTLQNYLKRHEGNDMKSGSSAPSNPFHRGAQEFGISQADPALSSSQQPKQASSTIHILSLLLRLRQCCCHLSLLRKTLDSSELQGDGIVLSLEEQLSALSLSSSPSPSDAATTKDVCLNGTPFASLLFEDGNRSTKISAIVAELEAIRRKSDDQKSVIVSQWTSMLDIVAVHLQQMGLRCATIDGTVNPKRRMDLVEEFNTDPGGPQVMLVSLCAGGVGLNLVGGNHLFLIDMHWNPALEDQACDRIYRVGQRKDVTIHRFVCEGTVEEKISTLQVRKKELAQNVLSGTGSTFTKLSLADLRIIFGV
uniref:transcription termination factor 2 n=1 Tax=Doryrhamphus excisus TaxID=161450 RepID=UPI0025AE23C8|nr:transcription termination factor 2 [Doryrhamphus excisus]